MMNKEEFNEEFENIKQLTNNNHEGSTEIRLKSVRKIAREWCNLSERQQADVLDQAVILKTFTGKPDVYDAGLALEAPYAEYKRNAMHREVEASIESVSHLSNALKHKEFDRLWMLQTQGIELTDDDEKLWDGVSAYVYTERANIEKAKEEQAFIKQEEEAQAQIKAEAEQKLKNDNFGAIRSVTAETLKHFTPLERQEHIDKYIKMATDHSESVTAMKRHTGKIYSDLYKMGIRDLTINLPEEI